VARNALLYALAPATLMVIAVVGAATAFLAASIGLLQNDIKKVLAYSTVSQLGFMFLALGVGAFSAALFHLMTHAFFKACLFLGAGSVIHALKGEQDIRKMGGLRTVLPVTFLTFSLSTFTIAGFPPLSGFFSKDEILWGSFANGSPLLWAIGAGTALMTAFYIFRLSTLVFEGDSRFPSDVVPHEAPPSMTIPLIVLAVLAASGGLLGIPVSLGGRNILHGWFKPVFTDAEAILGAGHTHDRLTEYLLMTVSVCIALAGFFLARRFYRYGPSADDRLAKSAPFAVRLVTNKYFIDEFFQNTVAHPLVTFSDRVLNRIVDIRIIDGFVNGCARLIAGMSDVLRRLQTGITQHYATLLATGALLVLLSILLP
ncbi:MAG: proton-conducting transporter membrane subunit, partial [Bacteroidota bacterium]|nr:proton-conducting transporter membrane subunit [Bacteroidota bacterium]